MKSRWASKLMAARNLAGGVLILLTPVVSPGVSVGPATSGAVEPVAAAQPGVATIKSSAGVADILKMVDAGVSPDVVKAYVKTSPIAYNLSASEIIALKDRGVSQEIIASVIQHGGELRAQSIWAEQRAASVAAQPATQGAVTSYATAPAYYDYSQIAYPAYADVYPVSSYGCYSYGGGWPYYWPSSWSGGYPYCAPSCYSGGFGRPGPSFRGGPGYGYPRFGGGPRLNGLGGRPVHFAGPSSGPRLAGGFGGHPVSFGGSGGGFGGRSVSFGGQGGGGGFGGHPASFGGHGGGGSGGHPGGGHR
jgi:hypothetical protein